MEFSFKQTRLILRLDCLWPTIWLLISFEIFFALPPIALSQSTTVVSVEPPELNLIVGKTSNLTVFVHDSVNFYGLEIHLHFDPASVQLDADNNRPGIQVQSGDLFDEDQGFLVRNNADNQSGEIIYAFTLIAPALPMSGSGSLINFELEAIAKGMSLLELEAILASPDGMALPIYLQDGLVTVGTVGTGQPTIIPTTKSPSTPTQILPSTATDVSVHTSTPSVSQPPNVPTSTVTNTEITSTLPTLTPTETTQTQERTNTLEVIPSPNLIGITGVPTETARSTKQAPAVTEQAEQNESTSRSLGQLILVAIIILGIGLIGGAQYLNRRLPNNM